MTTTTSAAPAPFITNYTDRSRIEEHQRCPRRRFLGYHIGHPTHPILGLRPIRPSIDTTLGTAVHKGLEILLERARLYQETDLTTTDIMTNIREQHLHEAITEAEKGFFEIWDPWIAVYEGGEPSAEVIEAIHLADALIMAFVFSPWGMESMLERYDIIATEQELQWTMRRGENSEIIFNSRPDAILRSKITNQYLVWSLKTAKEMNNQWQQNAGLYDNQGISELVSAMRNYPNFDFEGVQMTYLLKGRKTKDDYTGVWSFTNPLIHPYAAEGLRPSEFTYAPDYYYIGDDGKNHRLTKEYKRCNLYEFPHRVNDPDVPSYKSIEMWIRDLVINQPDVVARYICEPPVYDRSADMTSWIIQTEHREEMINFGVRQLHRIMEHPMENSPKLYLTVLDQHFPMSRTSCLAPFRCQFIDMCHGGGTQTYVNQLFAGGSDSDEAIKIAMELGFATRDLNHPEGEYSEE